MSLHYKRSLNQQLIIYVVNSEYSVKGKCLTSEMQIKGNQDLSTYLLYEHVNYYVVTLS
jgi:hypothetical protein